MAERSDEDLDALRVPANAPARRRDGDWSLEESNRRQAGDPLGGGAADIEAIEQAQFRVQRRAAAGVYNSTSESRSLPLIALLAQVGLGGGLCAGLSYCWLLNAEAAKGTVWAIDALAHSDEWFFSLFGQLWGKPPGGPLTLIYAGANGANALRCLPLLFDRLVVANLPNNATAGDPPS